MRLPNGLGARFSQAGDFSGFLDRGNRLDTEIFDGRVIDVIEISDGITGDRVIEFRDAASWGGDSFVAITVPEGATWKGATVSTNPRIGDIPMRLMLWVIDVAKAKVL